MKEKQDKGQIDATQNSKVKAEDHVQESWMNYFVFTHFIKFPWSLHVFLPNSPVLIFRCFENRIKQNEN